MTIQGWVIIVQLSCAEICALEKFVTHKIEPYHFSMEPNIAILKLDCGERKHDFEEKLSLQMNCHEVLVKITNQAA